MFIVKILVMLIILVSMVLLLVGLQHYLTKNQRRYEMDDTDNDRFRSQIDNNSRVMTRYNLFRKFLTDEPSDGGTPTVPRFFQGEGRRSNHNSERRGEFSSVHANDGNRSR